MLKIDLIFKHIFLFLLLTGALIGCHRNDAKQNRADGKFEPINWAMMLQQKDVPVYGYKIIHQYPHDTNSYTEGLMIEDGQLYESVGLYEKSKLKQVDLKTGKAIREYVLPAQYFGEGMTILNDRIYQLTYQENTGFIYDKNTFKQLGTFRYDGEGWGLTTDGHYLIMSNGSATLYFLDFKTFAIHHTVIVHHQQQNIGKLNELEYINGKIYSNIFESNVIAIISPQDGHIEGWINLNGLNPIPNAPSGLVLNGIAYTQQDDLLWVTGKGWPFMYAIKLVKRA